MKNRYFILTAATVISLVLATSYVWSVFRNPLMAAHGWDANQVTLAYSLFMGFCLVGNFAGGPLAKKLKPSVIVFIGGMLQGAGFFLTGVIDTLPMLYICYSVLAGFGNGLLYNAAVVTATKWFPDKKGMANGFAVGAMGLAPLVFAPLANAFIQMFDVFMSFKLMGGIMIVLFGTLAWLIKSPEPGWAPSGWVPSTTVNVSRRNLKVIPMLKTPLFYVLWIMLLCAICAGSMMTGQGAALAQYMANATPEQGALMVGIMAVASFFGRLILASLSDKIGRYWTYLIAMAIIAVVMLFVFANLNTFVTFMVGMCTIGFCFGGCMSMLPGLVDDVYGKDNFPINYPFVYSGFTAASFVGPLLASNSLVTTGSYDSSFYIAGGLAVLGCVLVLVARGLDKSMSKKEDAEIAKTV